MVDKFTEKIQQKHKAPENNAEGCFDCQTCNETVEGAYYDVRESTLTWVCSSRHESQIKGIAL